MYALMARTILLYLCSIVAGLRIMGKRQIGELQPSELVVTILISNIATLPIQDVDVPLSGGIVPILTIVCFEVFISGLTMRSRTARRLFCGGPKMVIRDGQYHAEGTAGSAFFGGRPHRTAAGCRVF